MRSLPSSANMADYLTSSSTQQMKSRVIWLYVASNSPNMNKTLLLLFLFMGICFACFVTFLPKFMHLVLPQVPVSTSGQVSTFTSFTESETESKFSNVKPETSVVLRVRQKLPISSDVKKEAVSAMNIALNLQEQGKKERAMKIFQHALALDPSHADILTAYGEFLELHMDDVMRADHYYKIALDISPQHRKALINIQRTSPIVEEIDQKRFNRIDQKRTAFYTVPSNHPALRRAKKEAYFAHIYHSNAIEGNTLTLMQTRAIIETRVAVGGKSLMEQNEVLGLDAALSYMNSTLVGRVGRLALQDLLDLHLRVLGFVDPSQAGRYRTTQVFVGEFTPPPPVDVPLLMDEFITWLNSEEAFAMHPIEFAALAHYKLVVIHPFYDGNGRTSRLLMNLILMQAGYPPVAIEVEDRLRYYETLELANNGDIRPFIRFIAECTERTLDQYLAATMEDGHSLQESADEKNSSGRQRIIYIDNEE